MGRFLPDGPQDLWIETVVLPVAQICQNSFSWEAQQEVPSRYLVVVHDFVNILGSRTNLVGRRLLLVPALSFPSFQRAFSDPVCQHFLGGHCPMH